MQEHWQQAVRIFRRIAERFPLYADHPKTYAAFEQSPYDLFDNAKEHCIYPTKAWQIQGRDPHKRMWVFDQGARVHFEVSTGVPTYKMATKDIVF